MAKRSLSKSMLAGALCCLFLLLSSACTSLPVSTGGPNTPTSTPGTQTGAATQTPPQTVPMPQTDTSCPATNTARAAVMRTLVLGTHQNLVYIFNDASTSHGILRRYDTSTSQKTDIVTSGIQILQAQISSDGQWVLFLTRPNPASGLANIVQLQLVRMDGQGLQTLMCLPYVNTGSRPLITPDISLQWSVDEKTILISYNAVIPQTQQAVSSIDVLNVSSGALKPAFLDPADSTYLYTVITWLNNKDAYIIKRSISSPNVPATLFLMDTTTATISSPGLQQVLNLPAGIFSMDSSFDGTQLFIADCQPPSTQTITTQPATGGTSHSIYNETDGINCVNTVRAISSHTLLLVVLANAPVTQAPSGYQIWTMQTDGSNKHILNTLPVAEAYNLNESSQFTWSNVSRDGASYALEQAPMLDGQLPPGPDASTPSIILIGSLNGGNPTVIATTAGTASTASLAGWTTM